MRAIALLSLWKTRNALKTLFTDPRKLIPAVVFIACISFSFGMSLLGMKQQSSHPELGEVNLNSALFDASVFLAMILVSVGTIDTGLGDGLLAFGLSDVDYVFPSPISRRVVLAYRLPSLTFGALFSTAFLIYMYRVIFRMIQLDLPAMGHADPPAWCGPAGVALCVGLYLNLAMFIAIRFENRRVLHRLLTSFLLAGLGVIGLVSYFHGVSGFLSIMGSPILKWAFIPCHLAAAGLAQEVHHVSNFTPIGVLFLGYLGSLIPMFATNSNYYEQSIASSEKVAAWRRATKGGLAAQQASRAATVKYKSTRTYTIPPFGQGPGAMAWAHLSAAAKKPYVNFLAPAAGGVACGVLAVAVNRGLAEVGFASVVAIFAVTLYSSMGFMASAKTASESAVRRRDLLAPLPVKNSEAVIANLAVPWIAMLCNCICAGVVYALASATLWPTVLAGMLVVYPLRLGARMVLQYILVLSYPDFSDKVQQLLAAGVYYFFAAPLLIGELIFSVPALLLHSFSLGLVMLGVLEAAYLGLLLLLAGIATDRAVASGEPVKLIRLLLKKT